MVRKKWVLFRFANMLADLFIVLLSYHAAFSIRHDLLGGVITIDARTGIYRNLSVIYAVLIVLVLYILHVYERQQVMKTGRNIACVLAVNIVGIVAWMALLYTGKIIDISRIAFLLMRLLSFCLITIRYMAFRRFVCWLIRKGLFQEHYILVGNGHLAHQYLADNHREVYPEIIIDGYVSKVQKPELGKCLGSYEDLSTIAEANQIDGFIIALEPHEIHFMKYVMETAGKEGLQLRLIPFFNDYYPAHPEFDLVGKTKLVNLRATPLNKLGNALIKRLVDIVGSSLLIVLTSPIMLLITIGVRFSSPGSVIFSHNRVGKNKKPFVMHKFRSMKDQVDHEGWTTSNDSRRTPFGVFIRKYSLDELPQLFDVLVGNMSLVGPRPELPRYVRQFKEEIPLYLVRQQVRPGMTGWAQIHGLRGDTSIEKRVEYDIWYIENWSLGLDIKILLKTAFGRMKNNE